MAETAAHTPGPWFVRSGGGSVSTHARHEIYSYPHTICRLGPYPGREKDARLIAAAPDGLNAAMMAYLALLRTPHASVERLVIQATLCALRDFIAKATDQDAEYVQNIFEAKATGGT